MKGITIQQIVLGLALLAALCWNLAHANEISQLQVTEGPTGTRAELHLSAEAPYRTLRLSNPERFVVDLPDTAAVRLRLPAPAGVVRAVRTGQPAPGTTRIVFDLAQPVVPLKPHVERAGDGSVRLVLEWPGDGKPAATASAPVPVAPAPSTAPASAAVSPAPGGPLASAPRATAPAPPRPTVAAAPGQRPALPSSPPA
ncbi:MAG: AMIN domain-containing protein, partial [Lysobacteraceae bacterium]